VDETLQLTKKKIILTLIIACCLLTSGKGLAQGKTALGVQFDVYKNDSAQLKSFQILKRATISNTEGMGDYKLVLVSPEGEIAYSSRFSASFSTHGDGLGENGGLTHVPINLSKVSRFYRLPYTAASKLQIKHNNELIYETAIPAENYCGSGLCETELGLNHNNCPQDCPSGQKDNYCDQQADTICDPDCEAAKDPDCKQVNNGNGGRTNQQWWLIGGVLALLIFVVLLAAIKTR